jgi:hypothetical protein
VRRGRALAALVVVVAGCAGGGGDGDEQAVPATRMRLVVLQPADLSKAFVRFDEGPVRLADTPPGPRGDPERFGREGGWKARYRRPGSPGTEGPLVVESRIDLFDGEEGAKSEFDAYRDELEREAGGSGRWLDVPRIGDDALAATSGSGLANSVRVFRLVWRDGNATASIAANGFEGRLRLADVLKLGRKQQRRIAAALVTD